MSLINKLNDKSAIIRHYRQFDMILCGHINLMPMAWLLGKVLRAPRGIPAGLEYFAFPNFSQRLHEIVNQVVRRDQQA